MSTFRASFVLLILVAKEIELGLERIRQDQDRYRLKRAVEQLARDRKECGRVGWAARALARGGGGANTTAEKAR